MARLTPVTTLDESQSASLPLFSPPLVLSFPNSTPLSSHFSRLTQGLVTLHSPSRLSSPLCSVHPPCRPPLLYTRMNSLPSRFQVASRSMAGCLREGNMVGCANGGSGCAPQRPSASIHAHTHAHTDSCCPYPQTHATYAHMSTYNHPLWEQCVFNWDLNICPLTGCLPRSKLD